MRDKRRGRGVIRGEVRGKMGRFIGVLRKGEAYKGKGDEGKQKLRQGTKKGTGGMRKIEMFGRKMGRKEETDWNEWMNKVRERERERRAMEGERGRKDGGEEEKGKGTWERMERKGRTSRMKENGKGRYGRITKRQRERKRKC